MCGCAVLPSSSRPSSQASTVEVPQPKLPRHLKRDRVRRRNIKIGGCILRGNRHSLKPRHILENFESWPKLIIQWFFFWSITSTGKWSGHLSQLCFVSNQFSFFCIQRVITVTRVCSISQVVTEIPVFENICFRISGEIEFVGNIWLWLPIIRPFTPPLFVFPRSQLASLLRLYVATLVIVIIQ